MLLFFFFLRVGKRSEDCLFKAVRSAGRGRGLGRTREKRLENGKEEGRFKKIEKLVEKGRDHLSNAEVNQVESPWSSGLDDWGQTRDSG